MKIHLHEVDHINGDIRDNRIDNLRIVKREIEVDPIPTFHGGTEYGREHQWLVIGLYCVMAAIGAGWAIAWMLERVG